MKQTSVNSAGIVVATLTLFIGTGVLRSSNCRKVNTKTWTEAVNHCHGYGPPMADPNCNEVVPGSPLYDGEAWQYTETTSLCYTNDCSPGQMSTEREPGVLISQGEIGCTVYNLIPLPEADPELCPCQCEECDYTSGASSLLFHIRLSRPTQLRRAAHLHIYQKDASRRLYTPAVLSLHSEEGLKVYRNPDHSIRQILSPDTLADVVVTSPESYEVRIHALPAGWERERDGSGYLVPPGEALRAYRFRNPNPGTVDKIDIDILVGKSARTEQFAWHPAEGRWTLLKDAGASQRSEAIEHYDKEKGVLTKTARITDLKTGSVRDTVRIFRDYPFGRRLLSTEKLRDGVSLSLDIYTYGENPSDVGSYGRLLSRRLHDGSWERFEYDSRGRYVKKLAPWKDSPFDSPEDEVKTESYAHLSLDPASPHYHPGAQFVRIDEAIAGVEVATTYRLQTRDPRDGSHLRIEERAATPGGHFGEKGNRRTTTRYYPEREADPASGLIRSTETPDGRLVIHRYESGDYDGEEGVPGLFAPRVGGAFLRTTKIETTAAHREGIPGKSLATVRVESPVGALLLEETRLVQEGFDPAAGPLLSWTGHAYDENRRKLLSRDASGVIGEYRYSPCCGKLEWERNRDGVETSYVRDADDRVTARIVKAPGRPEVETHYDYGPFGQLVGETVVAGDLVRETRHQYDEEGERIATTTPDGLTTRFEHDHANHVHTTVLPGGATRIETRYLDGQVKGITGTSLVAQHYDYGVDAATGHRWTQTFVAKADGPRWSRGTIDALGQSIMHETPGHGEGVILASHTAYDDKGRVTATQSGWRRPSAGADDEKGSEFHPLGPITLQTYDEDTGEPLLSGQDLDGDDQLVPGKDRVAKSERRYEEIDGAWWEVTRQWSYPLELKGEPYLVSEQRQRLTGLGRAHEDPAFGVLVAESVQLVPGLPQKGAEDAKMLQSKSLTYRNRETGLVTVVVTDPKGLVTTQRTEGGLIASVEAAGAKTAFAYDALGRRVSVLDPRTGESKTVYDPKTGRVIAEIDPEGRATRYVHYPADHPGTGRLATIVNADGKKQHLAYTTRGEQRGIWGEGVQPLLYEYNDYGEMVAMRTFQTTPEGDPSHEEDKGAKTAWHFHEPTGALLHKEYADGHGPTYVYTEAGQLESRTWARDSRLAISDLAVSQNQESKTAKGKMATSYSYDETTLQLKKSTATDGVEVTYEYNPEGQLAKVTDATGTREFEYDLRGQVLKESVTLLTGPETPPIRYEIHRSYTPLGQPESVHLVSAADESLSLDHKVVYSWNTHGQLSGVTSLAGEFTYDYDPTNPALLTKMTGPAHIVETTYEPHRNLITGVVNRIKSSTGILPVARAGASDQKPAVPTPQGPAPQTVDRIVSSYSYVNDVLGRRETISQGGEAFLMLKLGETKVDVAYNDRSEVVGAVYRSGGEARQSFDYDYDAIGNRRSFASEVRSQNSGVRREEVSYVTNALNQYESISVDQRNFDDNRGNGLGRPSPASPPIVVQHDLDGNLVEDDKNRYTWDSENRLVRVDSKDGTLRIEYTYDFQSRRTIRREYQRGSKDSDFQLLNSVFYLYDDWNVISEYSQGTGGWIDEAPASPEGSEPQAGDGDQLTSGPEDPIPTPDSRLLTSADEVRYLTWGRDLSGSLQGAGGVGGLLVTSEGESHRYPVYDANGNVSQLLDGAGKITAAYFYDPFGNVTEMAGAQAAENPWRFSTKPVDSGTGWPYYGYRWLDTETGRWVSRDPIEESGGVNLYGFVGNQPLDSLDKLGLCEDGGPPFWENSDGKWSLEIDFVEEPNPGLGTNNVGIEKVVFTWNTTAMIKCICDGRPCYRSGERKLEMEKPMGEGETTWTIPSAVGPGISVPTRFADALAIQIGNAINLTKPYLPPKSVAGVLGSFIRKHFPNSPTKGDWTSGSPCTTSSP